MVGTASHEAGEASVLVVASLVDDPLPDGGAGTRVIGGVGHVLKGQVVCFPFHGLGDALVVPCVCQ